MKSLKQIREASGGKEAYQKFFNSLLKKFGVSSPSELKGDKKKEFFDAIDKGWDGDNEKPEKNETYTDPDNLDPDTTLNPDEQELKAGYMKAHKDKKGKMMHASYKKEDVTEKTKLKGGRGKAEVDINWVGDRKDIKFASTKYKIKIKPHSDGAIVTGDKQKILAYLTGQDYAMDDEDIEDLYPELMEDRSPKPLSIIRLGEFSGDAETQRKKKRRFEDKESDEYSKKHDPETKGMKEKAKVKLSTGDMMKIAKIADKNSGDMQKAIKLIDKVKKGASEHPDVMSMLKLANEDVKEGFDVDRRTKGFKAAMVRSEKAKKVREKSKNKKAHKKDQAELDVRFEYDGEVDSVLAAANSVMNRTKLETAANAISNGGVDMAPNSKKKKKAEKIFARKY